MFLRLPILSERGWQHTLVHNHCSLLQRGSRGVWAEFSSGERLNVSQCPLYPAKDLRIEEILVSAESRLSGGR